MQIDKSKLEMKMLDSGVGSQAELARRARWSKTWTNKVFKKIDNGDDLMLKTIQVISEALRCPPQDVIVQKATTPSNFH